MNRRNWIDLLHENLRKEGLHDTAEILADYEEHFNAAIARGKSEEDIAAKLGDPALVARAHQAEALVTRSPVTGRDPDMGAVMKATLRMLVLTPFNFLMLIGPFLIFAVFLVTGWSMVLAFAGVSLVALLGVILAIPALLMNFWFGGAIFFGSLGVISMTVFGVLTMYLITRWVISVFVSYLQWNVNFVIGKN